MYTFNVNHLQCLFSLRLHGFFLESEHGQNSWQNLEFNLSPEPSTTKRDNSVAKPEVYAAHETLVLHLITLVKTATLQTPHQQLGAPLW